MKLWILVAFGAAFTAITSFFAPEQAWVEAVSASFVPYVAVPIAVGWVADRRRAIPVALLGGGAATAMVLAFYLARPLLDDGIGVLWADLFYWSLIGAIAGSLLAFAAWRLRPHVKANERQWTLGAWLFFALLPGLYFLYTGWGRTHVATSSGTVTIGYSTTDVIVASLVLATFHGGMVLAAIHIASSSTNLVDT